MILEVAAAPEPLACILVFRIGVTNSNNNSKSLQSFINNWINHMVYNAVPLINLHGIKGPHSRNKTFIIHIYVEMMTEMTVKIFLWAGGLKWRLRQSLK